MSRRILIVGGVAGGMGAAARARRMDEGAEIVVFERGGYVSFANCGLPYHIGGEIVEREKILVVSEALLRNRFRIDVRTGHEVRSIDRAAKTIAVTDLKSGEESVERYDTLILSPGAAPIRPPLPGLDHPKVVTLRNVADMDRILDLLKDGSAKRAVIVGAGFIGLEMAEALVGRGLKTTVADLAPQVLPPLDAEVAGRIEATLKEHGVRVELGRALAGVEPGENAPMVVLLDDETRLPADLVILAIGVRPEVDLAQAAGLTIGTARGIAVDEYQRTSDPDILALGDAAESVYAVDGSTVRIPLAGPANRQGRVAGSVAAGSEALTSGKVCGTAIVRVFDQIAGMTGLSEKAARRQEIDCRTAVIFAPDHASYYPGANEMMIKLVWEAGTGKVLGMQAVGKSNIARRIDVVATAIHFGGTVQDLERLDLAYAPPLGSAKDPIHLAGFVAANAERGETTLITVDRVTDAHQLVDVRNAGEFAGGHMDGAVNIPVDELRDRLGELDAARPTVVYCAVGKRGHVAHRILVQSGFGTVFNLTGGWKLAGGPSAGG